jgi:hypothetical protein
MKVIGNLLEAEHNALKRPLAESVTVLDALLPSILDKAFKGELQFLKQTNKQRSKRCNDDTVISKSMKLLNLDGVVSLSGPTLGEVGF